MHENTIQITAEIAIDRDELEFEFVRSSGPGGQNVNKVATAVRLRFDATNSPSLPEEVRERLLAIGGRRVTAEGVVVIRAGRYRTQEKNRADATQRLVELIARAAEKPRRRRRTRPSTASRERRLEDKRRRGEKKKMRKPVGGSDE